MRFRGRERKDFLNLLRIQISPRLNRWRIYSILSFWRCNCPHHTTSYSRRIALILRLGVHSLHPTVNHYRTLNCLPLTLFLHNAADDARHQLLTQLILLLLFSTGDLLGNVDEVVSDFQQNIILQEALQLGSLKESHL